MWAVCGLRLLVGLHFGGSRKGLAKNNLYWFVGMVGMVVLIEEFVFLVVEVVCLWMEGGFCCGSKEGDLYWFVGMVGMGGFDERSGLSLDGRWA